MLCSIVSEPWTALFLVCVYTGGRGDKKLGNPIELVIQMNNKLKCGGQ